MSQKSLKFDRQVTGSNVTGTSTGKHSLLTGKFPDDLNYPAVKTGTKANYTAKLGIPIFLVIPGTYPL